MASARSNFEDLSRDVDLEEVLESGSTDLRPNRGILGGKGRLRLGGGRPRTLDVDRLLVLELAQCGDKILKLHVGSRGPGAR